MPKPVKLSETCMKVFSLRNLIRVNMELHTLVQYIFPAKTFFLMINLLYNVNQIHEIRSLKEFLDVGKYSMFTASASSDMKFAPKCCKQHHHFIAKKGPAICF